MAIYTTGRTRTLVVQGTIEGVLRLYIGEAGMWGPDGPLPPPPGTISYRAQAYATITTAWGASVSAFPAPDDPITPTGKDLGTKVTADNGFGDTDEDVNASNYPSPPYDFTGSIDGEYSFSVDGEECIEISDGGLGTWPSYGGAAVPDPPEGTAVRFFERSRVGGSATATISAGGAEASATSTIGSADEIGYLATVWCDGEGANMDNLLIVTVENSGPGASPVSYVRTEGTARVEMSSGEVRLELTPAPPAGWWEFNQATGTATLVSAPDRAYQLDVALRAMEDPYPGALDVLVDGYPGGSTTPIPASGGGAAHSYSQRRYECSATLNGVVQTGDSVNEWQSLKTWVDPNSLQTAGEDTDDWRILLRGKRYNSASAGQAASYTLDDGGSLSPTQPKAGDWENVANATLSIDSGAVKAIVSGGAGAIRRTYDPDQVSLAGYRYLRIKIKADAADRGFRIQLGAKEWDGDVEGEPLEAGTDYAEFDIDLCCATNVTADKDGRDTRWPLPTDVDTITADGALWGAVNVAEIVIEGLENGGMYWIDHLSLVRRAEEAEPAGYSRLTFLPAFKSWIEDGGGTGLRRFLVGDTDGRQSLEEADATDNGLSVGVRTLTDLLAQINADGESADDGAKRNPGWSATANPSLPASDGADYTDWEFNYLNNNRPAVWGWGGGALFASLDEGPGRWHFGFDRDFRGSATVWAQMLFDQVDWYPGIGDVFELGVPDDTGDEVPVGALILRAVKMLRGQAHGLTFGTDQLPLPDTTVVVQEDEEGPLAGTGTSGPDGAYQTGSVYGRGAVVYDTRVLEPVEATFRSRKRQRASFRGGPQCPVLGAAPVFFPFEVQAGDADLLPVEEWRFLKDEGGRMRAEV